MRAEPRLTEKINIALGGVGPLFPSLPFQAAAAAAARGWSGPLQLAGVGEGGGGCAGAPVVVNPAPLRRGGELHIKELDGAGCQFLTLHSFRLYFEINQTP